VAKKTAKVLKGLKKDVAKLQERYDKFAGTLEKTREDQAAAYRELRDLLEERLAGRDADPVEQEDNPRDDKGPEVTEAAQRRAEELGIDLADVKAPDPADAFSSKTLRRPRTSTDRPQYLPVRPASPRFEKPDPLRGSPASSARRETSSYS
jgi:hypothetical protein